MIGIKPEIVQGAKADRIRVLVLGKRFGVPGYGIGRLSDSPWRAAVTLVVKRAIVCPARLLRRRVKADITDVCSSAQRHTERLNPTIEVLVVQGIFIVPDSGSWTAYFVAHEPDAIVARIRLDLIHCRACTCPSRDGRLQPRSGANRRKCEVGSAGD